MTHALGRVIGAAAAALAVGFTVSHTTAAGTSAAIAQGRGGAAPAFEADRLWPKPLPNHWLVGAITGIAVGPDDHIWLVHRTDSLALGNEAALAANPPGAEYCCLPAPAILEFDAAGTLVSHWGGAGTGFEWPVSPGGIAVDDRSNIWIAAAGAPESAVAGRNATGGGGGAGRGAGGAPAGGAAGGAAAGRGAAGGGAVGGGATGGGAVGGGGGAAGGGAAGAGRGGGGRGNNAPPRPADAHVLKFSRTGQFLLQIGHGGQPGAKDSTTELDKPAAVALDNAANELFVADGGDHQRVVVFDAGTGAFKRQWRGHGSEFTRLTGIAVSKDGMVYVSDRKNNRVQSFKKDGTFVKEIVISEKTTGNGSTWGVGLSSDAAQRWLFVPDGQDEKVWVFDRASLAGAGSFGDGGRQPGQFYAVQGVAMDSKGTLYTGEGYEGKRLQRWTRK